MLSTMARRMTLTFVVVLGMLATGCVATPVATDPAIVVLHKDCLARNLVPPVGPGGIMHGPPMPSPFGRGLTIFPRIVPDPCLVFPAPAPVAAPRKLPAPVATPQKLADPADIKLPPVPWNGRAPALRPAMPTAINQG